jgi:hypothetical protein
VHAAILRDAPKTALLRMTAVLPGFEPVDIGSVLDVWIE